MKLYAPAGNFRANKILITAKLLGTQVDFPPLDPKFTKSKDFMMLSPLKRLPILQTAEGVLTGSHAALRYLAANSALYSGPVEQLAEIDTWLDTIQNDFEQPLCNWIFPVLGVQDYDAHVYTESVNAVKAFLGGLEGHLAGREFLVGSLSIADVSLACSLGFGMRLVITPGLGSYPAVATWVEKMLALPEFRAVVGAFKRATEELKAPPKAEKKKEESKKPAKEEGKKSDSKKTDKKAAEPKPAAEDEEEEESSQRRAPNPLDSLPPSTFVLDSWKRLYANTKQKREVIGQFWEQYENLGWSIWLLKYQKAEGEGEVLYMTNNLVSMGFIQRLDGFNFRRYSFGVMGVYGEEPKLEVRGALMWRGQELTKELQEHPSFEYYERVRVDPANPEHRKLVEDYWCSEVEETVEGLRLREKHLYI